jgi:fatty-acyl-CoA synthase
MKFSFSTLGCPRWTLSEIVTAAKDLGYAGVELRGLGDDIFLPDARVFRQGGAGAAREFSSRGLAVPCIATECEVFGHMPDLAEKVGAYLRLAAALGCPNLRLLGDRDPWKSDEADAETVAANLRLLAPEAERMGVSLLLESNGIFSDSALLADTVRAVNSPRVAVLWDVNHPVRYGGETPEKTWANLAGLVRHVHVKDSVVTNGEVVYKMLGRGTLPLSEAFGLLKSGGYDGFVSLEWTKRWHQELEEPGIVFDHFTHHARRIWEKA